MTTPVPPNSSSLTTKLARDWVLRVREVGGTDTDWEFVRGLSTVTPLFEGSTEDVTDIDSGGWSSTAKTGASWRVEGSGNRKGETALDVYTDDPGQAMLRAAGRLFDVDGEVEFQIYRRDNVDEAYQGRGPVTWTDAAAGSPNALQGFSFTIAGNGAPQVITKPTTTP